MGAWTFTPEEIAASFPMKPWDHQLRTVTETLSLLDTPAEAMTVCLPTGAGKSLIASSLINLALMRNRKSLLMTNRKMLSRQTSENLDKHGIEHGVRAATMPEKFNWSANVQVSSMQTELSRVVKNGRWQMFPANLLIKDEGHQLVQGESLELSKKYQQAGAKIIMLTATPIGMNHFTPHLIVGATKAELRKCGAHVPAIVKGLNEFDTSRVRRVKTADGDDGEFSEQSIREEFWCQAIVGVVVDDWFRFNPAGRMTLVYAPGTEEALSLAMEFHNRGVPAASISSRGLWIKGHTLNDDAKGNNRQTIMDAWRGGEVKVLVNRYMLREAIDVPELYHIILATPIGSLKGYDQIVGRVIRRSKETPDHVLITDHAGNFWRHGSPNEDRDWHELYNMSEAEIREQREAKNKQDVEKGEEPVCCPKCGTVLKFGKCPEPPLGCGQPPSVTNPNRMRRVVQQNGQIIELENHTRLGEQKPKRKVSMDSVEQKRWNEIFWAARNSKSARAMNFNQARAAYHRKWGTWPPNDLKFMPTSQMDSKRKIRDVDMRDLRTDRFNEGSQA